MIRRLLCFIFGHDLELDESRHCIRCKWWKDMNYD